MSIELLFKIADTLETDPNTILGVKNNVASVDEALNELPLEMKYHLGTFVFRGFFMPEYCFLWRYLGIFSLPQNLVRVFERF